MLRATVNVSLSLLGESERFLDKAFLLGKKRLVMLAGVGFFFLTGLCEPFLGILLNAGNVIRKQSKLHSRGPSVCVQ